MPDELELRKLALEEKRFEFDCESKRRELALREEELARQREADARSRRFQFTPTATAIIAGILSLTTGGVTAFLAGFWSLKTQQDKNQAELALKEKERQFQIVIRATENRTPEEAAENLLFFVDIKYLPDADGSIRKKAEAKAAPVITSPGVQNLNNPLMDRHAQVTSDLTKSPSQQTATGTYSVVKHLLVDSTGHAVNPIPANSLSPGLSPRLIVLHFTVTGSAKSAAEYWASPENRTSSAHILIDRDGTVIQTIPFDFIAHHVGPGSYKGITSLNQCSIGIDLANWGELRRVDNQWRVAGINKTVPETEVFKEPGKEKDSVGWHNYTDEQIQTTIKICRALVTAYPEIEDIVGHEAVSPGRKTDPGPAFPIAKVRETVLPKRP
jgi:N-acetylmuramoyl-L-alanine amidase